MKHTKILALLILSLIAINAKAQETQNKNFTYIGLGGAGMTISGNYERVLFSKTNSKLLAGTGLGYFPLYVNGEMSTGTFNALFHTSYLYSIKKHHLEAGITNCLSVTADNEYNKTAYLLSPTIGYRYHNFLKKSIMLRIAYAPLISFEGISVTEKNIFYSNFFLLGIGYGF